MSTATTASIPARLPRSVILLTLGAIALRLMLFVGRGSYVAFDEGWYLVLGRNLWSGEGYTLSGLQHVALSPLFPILAGGLGRLLGDPIWAGRIVAGISSGLLILPCWSIFRRLAPPRVALTGVAFVAVAPSLAPFVVPYWIGWDLWVGAEPVLHLFLFTGIALFLRGWEEGGWVAGLGSGAALALAYLARPEAIGTFAFIGLGAAALALAARRLRVAAPPIRRLLPLAAGSALAFVAVAGPYWIYLHGELGEWTVTGRAVQLAPAPMRAGPSGTATQRPNRIEDMLWRGDEQPYIRMLYALDASGTRLANRYWGVRPDGSDVDSAGGAQPSDPAAPEASSSTDGVASPAPGASASGPTAAGAGAPSPAPDASTVAAAPGDAARSLWLLRYGAALGVAAPWYLWLFAAVGLFWPGRERRLELEAFVAVPLVLTSLVIARAVAIDPRTQAFLAPLAAFYAARGVDIVGGLLARRREGLVRGEMVPRLLVGALVVSLLGTSLLRLTLSLVYGSPHHIVAAQNATVGEVIARTSPADATVVSFHPALALYADRDWRVLPLEPMDRIVRYARTQPTALLVLSVFYPPEVRPLEEPHYLIVPVRPDLPEGRAWRIEVPRAAEVFAFGELTPRE